MLTHIGHDLDAWLRIHGESLPESVTPAHDGCIAYPTELWNTH